jgi:hypothetical protein
MQKERKEIMKKSKLLKRIVCAILCVNLVFLLSSCGFFSESLDGFTRDGEFFVNENPLAVVLVLGNHANAMAIPNDTLYIIEQSLSRAVYGGYFCVIVPDGSPTKISISDNRDFFAETARNATVLNNTVRERIDHINGMLQSDTDFVATNPEVDLLGALREAQNALSASHLNHIKDKQIIIVSTDVSTTGDLNLTTMDFLNSPPDIERVVEQLKDREGHGVLPNLTGIDVTFIGTSEGLAEVAEPQEWDTVNRRFVRELWNTVITNCTPNSVTFEVAAGWGNSDKTGFRFSAKKAS